VFVDGHGEIESRMELAWVAGRGATCARAGCLAGDINFHFESCH